MSQRYTMRISRLTVDKLGVRLYDKVSAVIAELIANSYDADAREVVVEAPMGEMLATKREGEIEDRGLSIVVRDDGIGMTPEQINEFYLKVGAERRNDPKRGDVSKVFNRKVMGRKGVGKLAPFGICSQIEIVSSGGELIQGRDAAGNPARGYLTAHLHLDRNAILSEDTDKDYHPKSGELDGTVSKKRGTRLVLSHFSRRQVPTFDVFERQLAQRFGIATANWAIKLVDNARPEGDAARERVVGAFSIEKMDSTELRFESVPVKDGEDAKYRVVRPDRTVVEEITAGFFHEKVFYPVTGWAAYSKQPYRDDLMAGIRIYCRGKIAAQTHIFNLSAGFHGEYDIRSYLVGELTADWLDEKEDLIQTDRRDILWSHELGKAFEEWGQKLVRLIGTMSRAPIKKKIWEKFQEVSKLQERIDKAFPGKEREPLREKAMELAKRIGSAVREEELKDEEHVNALVQLSLDLAPHIKLNEMLRAAADPDSPLVMIADLLKTARLAELSSFGTIALDRVRVIERVEALMGDPGALEAAFQELITQAPWLIDPQWSPITANESFETLKRALQKMYKERTKQDLQLEPFPKANKRADFVLSNQEGTLQLIEIKQPSHKLQDEEMERINTYVELMDDFFAKPGHEEFRKIFPSFQITLVCDALGLKGMAKSAFEGLKARGKLAHITWQVFLRRTRKMHESFLAEADKQKKEAARQA